MTLKNYRLAKVSGQFTTVIIASLAAFSALLVFAYNPLQDQVNGAPRPPVWPNASITWRFNPTPASNVDNPNQVATALSTAFNAWSGSQATLNGQTLNRLTVMRGADTSLTDPDAMSATDCVNIVSLVPSANVKFPTGTIAFAAVASAIAQGQPGPTFIFNVCGTTVTANSSAILIDADIEFNPVEQFSTATPPAAGRFDLQAVATHEFGHALGLDHSGIAHTVMYPFGDTRASIPQRDLGVDDIIGVAFLYPAAAFNSLGTISGRITLNGAGIYASHVVAIDTSTGNAVVDRLTNPDGTYKLVGVPPGTYNVLALPLGPDANTGVYSLDNFSGWTCGFVPNAPPCCDPAREPATCTGLRLPNPTNYTGKFF
jgi:hypothetical protein